MKTINLMTILFALVISAQCKAENKPMEHPNDSRIKTISFVKNDVIPIKASYKEVTHIDLGRGNKILDVIVGNSESWMIEQTTDQLGVLVKPLTFDDKTNLVVITDKRNYYFELLRANNAKSFGYVFQYPEDEFNLKKAQLEQKRKTEVNYEMSIAKPSPEDWNFSYVLAGSNATSPIQVFDDGNFMYLNFGKKAIPAIFSVDEDRKESVINYHRSGKYIVVQGMYRQLTLRSGSDQAASCVFNKTYDSSLMIDPDEVLANENATESIGE